MIVGEKVMLTAVREEDREQLFSWINDPALVRLSAPFRPVSATAHEAWFRELDRDPTRVVFAIRRAADDVLMGIVQLSDIHPIDRSAILRIRIGARDDQGRGYGTEALRLLLGYAWSDLNLQRIGLEVLGSNARARACYAKVGFREEGCLRRAAYIDGKWEDLIVMGALRIEAGDSTATHREPFEKVAPVR